jgi:hypothetical protein
MREVIGSCSFYGLVIIHLFIGPVKRLWIGTLGVMPHSSSLGVGSLANAERNAS